MLELKEITKRFDNRTILNKMSFQVPDGEILAIVGPSGAGKTTLLRCITGLETVDGGDFILDGDKFNPAANRDNDKVIGVVFQDFQLFPNLTVMDNVTLAPELALKMNKADATKRAQELIDELSLSGKEQLYPFQLSGFFQLLFKKISVFLIRLQIVHKNAAETSQRPPATAFSATNCRFQRNPIKFTQLIIHV